MPDEGKIEWCKHITTGYLDQYSTLTPGKTIYDVLKEAFNHLSDLEKEVSVVGNAEVNDFPIIVTVRDVFDRSLKVGAILRFVC